MNKASQHLKKLRAAHQQHGWIFGLAGLAAGLFLMMFVPSLTVVANSLILIAGFHIAGAIILVATIWYGGLRSHFHKKTNSSDGFDFGWDPSWTMGLAITAFITLCLAAVVQLAHPNWWIAAWILLFNSAAFFTGFVIMLGYRSRDYAVLPMVDIFPNDSAVILDAGCGAGRTTLALSKALRNSRIVALDRFDASYIEGGGRSLLEHNIGIAGLGERVTIAAGDLCAMPFPDTSFDSVVSTNVYDHLGSKKEAAMRETFRVLKPEGRFLLGISVPSIAMFAIANVLSFLLMSRKGWRRMASQTGFSVDGEWMINGTWFVLLVKKDSI